MMATAYYRNPADGVYVPLSAGSLSVSGITRTVLSISANTTLAAAALTDYVYGCTAALTATLPTAVGNTNRYTIKRTGTGVVTIATTGGQSIDGAGTFVMNVQYQSVDLVNDGANNWAVI
jgi:hypothetical protein